MTARRTLRAAAAGVAACAVAVLVLPSPADADTPYQLGWWNRFQATAPGLGAVLPAPPNVPEGGLYVAGTASSPSAFSALRYALDGSVESTLKLTVANGSAAGATIDACAITGQWAQGFNQDYAAAPTYDCAAKATGEVDATGSTITWKLPASLYRSDVYAVDIALLPGGAAPAQVAFAPPDDASFTHPPVESSTTDEPVVDSGALAPESAGEPAGAGTSSGSLALGPATSPLGEVGAVGGAAPLEAPSRPQSSGRGDPAFPLTPSQVAAALTDDDSRPERIGAFVALMLLAGALWFLGGRPVRAPRLLGGPGATAAATAQAPAKVGGIGRFARPRTAAPNRL